MKSPFTKAVAGFALAAAAALFIAPAAAQAYTPNQGAAVSDSTVAAGESVIFDVNEGTFAPGEDVTVSVTGPGSGHSFGMSRGMMVMPSAETVVPALEDGSIADLTITFGADASGEQTIAAVSDSNPVGVSAVVTIVPGADNGTGGTDNGAGTGTTDGSGTTGTTDAGTTINETTPGALAPTGGAQTVALWISAGVLGLAGLGIIVAMQIRQTRAQVRAGA